MIDDAMGFVDVMKGAIAKAAHGRVIFFAGDIVVSFVEQFHGAVIASGAIHARIDRRG
jgi:ethanolamine utilization microcompartment shell protein EutS